MRRKRSTPEGAVLRAVLDLLAAHRILCFRMNSGAHVAEHGGKKRLIRYGVVGMADVLAFVKFAESYNIRESKTEYHITPLWIEAKAGKGKQTFEQKNFQHIVEAEGHSYLVVHNVDELIAWLKENGVIR